MALASAPYHATIADEPIAQAYWAKAADGINIRVAHWALDGSKGTVLLFPGRTEYIEKYAVTAADLAQHGYGTFAIDWRGQGLADRLTNDSRVGHVIHFPDYQRDVAAAMEVAQELDLPKPWYLLGHSMGGCIGLRALLEGLPVSAAGFSGPMWGVGSTALIRTSGKALGAVVTAMGLGHHFAPGTSSEIYVLDDAFEDNLLTTDPAMYDRMKDQARANPEMMIAGFSYRWAYEALKECGWLAKQDSPKLPCFTILGTDEAVVNPSAIKDRMARWPGGELRMVQGGMHEVLMDSTTMRGPAIAEMAALFAKHS